MKRLMAAGLAAALVVLLPRWRARRSRDGDDAATAHPLSEDDAARLEADMARFK